jgi:hypothetical protein
MGYRRAHSIDGGFARCFVRTRPLPVAVAVSAALALVYVIWEPATTDLAAQTFRAELWEREGFVIWNPDWYGGHTVPGYSLLYPPLGAWLGPALLGGLSAVAATWLFARLVLARWGESAWLGVLWFGFASAVATFSGRITFALGLALGLAALTAVQRRRTGWAALAGLLTAAASPVAGLFLLLACAAIVLEDRYPLGAGGGEPAAGAAAGAGVGAALGLAALALAFPTGGYQPFTLDSFVWIPLVAVATLALVGRREGAILWGAILYVALALAAFAVQTPLGGNAIRLGATFAGPLLAILLIRRRPLLLAVVAVPLLWWQWHTTVSDVAATVGDESAERAYYEPLLAELDRRNPEGRPIRVRVPPTRNRGEAVYLPPAVMLDGGWMRQLESDDFDFLERDEIGAREYRRWSRSRGLSYLAVNDAEPDKLAVAERELLEGGRRPGPPPVWSDGHWRLYELSKPGRSSPLVLEAERSARGPDRTELTSVEPDGFTVRTDATSLVLDLNYTPYFEVVEGDACVEEAPAPHEGKTLLTVGGADADARPARPRAIRVEARLSLRGLLREGEPC